MISKCAVNGTQVDFHCSNVDWWYVGSGDPSQASDGTLTVDAIIDADNDNYTAGGFQILNITCVTDTYVFVHASLIITGKLL